MLNSGCASDFLRELRVLRGENLYSSSLFSVSSVVKNYALSLLSPFRYTGLRRVGVGAGRGTLKGDACESGGWIVRGATDSIGRDFLRGGRDNRAVAALDSRGHSHRRGRRRDLLHADEDA